MKNKFFAYAAITLVLFATVGCTNWERTTFQTLAASKATIDQAQVDYEAGTVIPHNLAAYQAINTAKQAQITAVNAMVVYEQLKATGATPTALNTAQVEVVTALSELPSLIVKIKALYIGGK
jgi:hypothetical protein